MELILQVNVTIKSVQKVKGNSTEIVMISFNGNAEGPYFTGNILEGAVDTQKISNTEDFLLSARYMLEGTDDQGKNCRIFIENNGSDFKHCVPTLVTDSDTLSWIESIKAVSTVEVIENGVIVRIYQPDK